MPVSLSLRTRMLCLSLCLGVVPASRAATPTPGVWSGSAELGASVTTGNSRTSSVNGRLKLRYASGPWSQKIKLSTIQATQNGQSSANRTVGSLSSRYLIDTRNYLFGTLRASHDAFSGYRYQASAAAGLGRRLWNSSKGELNVEAGPGYRMAKLTTGQAQNSVIARVHARFSYKLTDTATFTQDWSVEAGTENTELGSETGFGVDVTRTLAMKLAYNVQHNTHVPAGTGKTDTFTSVNLVYSFGS